MIRALRNHVDDRFLDDLETMTGEDELCRHAARVCVDAAHAASICAATGWANEHLAPGGTSRVTRWCIAAARVLSASADVLAEDAPDDRVHLVVAQSRAALVAAQECAAACEVDEDVDPVRAECAAACRRADAALRGLLRMLAPRAADPLLRASGL